jgi:hypothetical protein
MCNNIIYHFNNHVKVTNNFLTTIRESESYTEQLTNQLEMARYAQSTRD